jgi:hypothetical protein
MESSIRSQLSETEIVRIVAWFQVAPMPPPNAVYGTHYKSSDLRRFREEMLPAESLTISDSFTNSFSMASPIRD